MTSVLICSCCSLEFAMSSKAKASNAAAPPKKEENKLLGAGGPAGIKASESAADKLEDVKPPGASETGTKKTDEDDDGSDFEIAAMTEAQVFGDSDGDQALEASMARKRPTLEEDLHFAILEGPLSLFTLFECGKLAFMSVIDANVCLSTLGLMVVDVEQSFHFEHDALRPFKRKD